MSRYFDDNIFHSGIDEDEILHYGVKGMKWRKRLKSRLSKSALEDNRKARKHRYDSQAYSNWADSISRQKAAKRAGRKTYKSIDETHRILPNGQHRGGFHESIHDVNYDVGDDKWKKEVQKMAKKEEKQRKKYSRRAKIKEKLAKIIGG